MLPSFTWLTETFRTVWQAKGYLLASAMISWVLAKWLFGLLRKGLELLMVSLNDVLNQIGNFGDVSLATVQWIGYVNAVIPLSEMVSLLVVFYSLWLSIILVRWVKSFIPTVAN